jgi:beta-fructofuranosidase
MKRPVYHFSPERGWMNDPNGIVYDGKAYHVFYQHNPKDIVWGPMHWGHAKSPDLLHFRHCPIAFYPDKPYDNEFGCFSGSALRLEDGRIAFLYTGVSGGAQQQCLAYMDKDGSFSKYEHNPVIASSSLPEGYDFHDFRDPFLFKEGDSYFALLAAKNGSSKILLYESKDLMDWRYRGLAYQNDALGEGMFECPGLARFDGVDALIFSKQFTSPLLSCKNIHGSFYILGKMDVASGRFIVKEGETPKELDYGYDFYAPLVFKDKDGHNVLMAWQECWDRVYPSAKEGYVGKLTLPRSLRIKGDHLYQDIISLDELYEDGIEKKDIDCSSFNALGLHGDLFEFKLDLANPSLKPWKLAWGKGQGKEMALVYDGKTLYLDRSNDGSEYYVGKASKDERDIRYLPLDDCAHISLRLINDKTAFELSINDGYLLSSGTISSSKGRDAIELSGDIAVARIRFHNLKGE